MNDAPIETREIDEAELDTVAGGISAMASLNADATLDGVEKVTGLIGKVTHS